MIDGFTHLSSASFNVHCQFNQNKQEWLCEPELAVSDAQRLTQNTFTCRLSGSHSKSLTTDVHIWIGQQMITA